MSENREKKEKLRRYYDEEFKRNAVEMLENGGRSAVQLARELGISDCSLGKWKRLYGKEAAQAGADAASQAQGQRIKELERELGRVSRQRDILKKALAILGQEPGSSTP